MNAFGFKTLLEFTDCFKDEAACVAHFTEKRFRNGKYCPHCKHAEIYTFRDGKRFRCAKCKMDFTIKTKTLFGDSKIAIRKWYMAMFLISSSGKGMSSIQLAKQIGVTQKTAWFMDHRIRQAMQQDSAPLQGTIEADETFIGGKARNMHASRRREIFQGRDRGTVNKVPVFGMKTRDGQIRAQVIKEVSSLEIHPIIKANIAEGTTLYTDEHRAYNNLGRLFKRGIVRHGLGEYVKGNCFTNGIESFWAILKRGYHGVYHWMSKKHLQRYVNEFVFRFNLRMDGFQNIFSVLVENIANSMQLTYQELTYEQTA
jgi:transposase-like protein